MVKLFAWLAGLMGSGLVALGFAFITYLGVQNLLEQVTDDVLSAMGDLPTFAATFGGMLGLDIAINLFLSALGARVGLIVGRKYFSLAGTGTGGAG